MIDQLLITELAVQRGGRSLFTGFSLKVREGEAVAVTGRNGAGKTTLLRAVAGLVRPEAGEVAFGSADPTEARAGGIHLVGHQDGLKPARTAGEELAFWNAWDGAEADTAAASVDQLHLGALLGLEVRRLSAGQRRRVALARLLAAPRPLWLLDEPLSPLDAGWRVRFGEIMARHLDDGGMILAAVHDPLPIPARAVELPA
jgi:heme exporter protein A